ncbi:superoxide dismutase family protein [Gallaecimonas pentaromativorans]|uniref:Cu/Zn superoxide dismutase n=1 Tax=Gallaecimonas pentaromativorans TaxID=584787 RepID=A0A3N1P4F8_9GAMM|nr:superoxide dismutase family protein [Gallaecimonas pentaromativorans]MED5526879.1 superoxide dismutase family protein [Pseudomonadota bacterium]ROQ23343.1 Cu/Zn superoxide dismutase [Gallaecimonas pentaromativorans]
MISFSSKKSLSVLGAALLLGSLSVSAQAATLSAKVGAYPGTSQTVTGKVKVSFHDGRTLVHYDLKGLGPVTNGGLHIHVGKTCDDAEQVGGHYFSPTTAGDYWKSGLWSADSKGEAIGSFTVVSDLGYKDNKDHAIVVHGPDGARIGCGILK